MSIVGLCVGRSVQPYIVSSLVHRMISMKNSAKMRTRMVSLQTLWKRDCKAGSLRILRKEELKCALYVGRPWMAIWTQNLPRCRPRKWGWGMSCFYQSCTITEVEQGQQHFNISPCVAKIYLRMVMFTHQRRQQYLIHTDSRQILKEVELNFSSFEANKNELARGSN